MMTLQQPQYPTTVVSNSTQLLNNNNNDHHHHHRSKRLKMIMKEKNDYITKFAIILTVVTILLMGIISITFSFLDISSSSSSFWKGIIRTNNNNYNNNANNNFLSSSSSHDTVLNNRYLLDSDGTSEIMTTTNRTDYSKYSCNYIYEITPNVGTEQCSFASTCNGGEGVWATFVFCSSANGSSSRRRWILCILLAPVALLWMILLFRMLGSTAEDYFSPALEMLSVRCHLPPRFAGVTLLALGNGAADVSATVAAITNDPDQGYLLSLGALTGAAMFISGVISAAVILASSTETGSAGFQCRGAFTRDVIALLITVFTVYYHLSSGIIGPSSVTAFLTLYCVFVGTVLIADIYHRTIVIPRLAQIAAQQELNRQVMAAEQVHQQLQQQGGGDSTIISGTTTPSGVVGVIPGIATTTPNKKPALASNLLSALSNYDDTHGTPVVPPVINDGLMRTSLGSNDDPSHSGWGVESEVLGVDDRPIILHGANGILNRPGHGHGHHPTLNNNNNTDGNDEDNEYSMLSDGAGDGTMFCVDTRAAAGISNYNPLLADSWYEAIIDDGITELRQHAINIWNDIIESEELHIVQKFLLICELPATAVRQLTVPIPCDGFYVRAITAVAFILSPLWFILYLYRSHDVNILTNHPYIYLTIQVIMLVLSLILLRYGPPTHVDGLCPMPLYLSAPLALYGFMIAATWIDTIADSLVSLLNFIGIILYIPGPVIGLTVLAWGNSMGDLSANITMARKGLGNMAMTACFAGPVFNILVGLGFGFSSLSAKTGIVNHPVQITSSIQTGFLFLLINGICILYTGLFYGKGIIPYQYAYISFVIYTIYVLTSISLQYNKDSHSNDDTPTF